MAYSNEGLLNSALGAKQTRCARHLSFLELGRASPSPEMVIRLATALDVPLRQHNALLLAGGFAPVWRETALGAPELAQVRHALDYIMAQQEPFPAAAVDRHWNLLKANKGMTRLVTSIRQQDRAAVLVPRTRDRGPVYDYQRPTLRLRMAGSSLDRASSDVIGTTARLRR